MYRNYGGYGGYGQQNHGPEPVVHFKEWESKPQLGLSLEDYPLGCQTQEYIREMKLVLSHLVNEIGKLNLSLSDIVKKLPAVVTDTVCEMIAPYVWRKEAGGDLNGMDLPIEFDGWYFLLSGKYDSWILQGIDKDGELNKFIFEVDHDPIMDWSFATLAEVIDGKWRRQHLHHKYKENSEKEIYWQDGLEEYDPWRWHLVQEWGEGYEYKQSTMPKYSRLPSSGLGALGSRVDIHGERVDPASRGWPNGWPEDDPDWDGVTGTMQMGPDGKLVECRNPTDKEREVMRKIRERADQVLGKETK